MAPYNNEIPKSKKPEDKHLKTKNLTDASMFKFCYLIKQQSHRYLNLKVLVRDTSQIMINETIIKTKQERVITMNSNNHLHQSLKILSKLLLKKAKQYAKFYANIRIIDK